jgi:hypothetical protein
MRDDNEIVETSVNLVYGISKEGDICNFDDEGNFT